MEASALHAPARLTGITLSAPLLRLRSDEQLVALFRAGCDGAFDVIHDRYRQRLFAYVRQMLSGSRQDSEDALQDVFMRAHAALRASDQPISLRAWLYRVAHNRCIDHLRRPPVIPVAELEPPQNGQLLDPLAQTERREDLRQLITDVRRLPAQQRSMLLMRELEGASYAELASAHDVSIAAVKSLLVRARIGLVRAAEARDVACVEIRDDLVSAHERGVRSTGRARRHLRDCDPCREYRESLRTTQRALRGVLPTGNLPLLAKLFGLGGSAAGSGAAATGGAALGGGGIAIGGGAATVCKVAAVVCTTVFAAGGAVEVGQQLDHRSEPRATASVSTAVAGTAVPAQPATSAGHPAATTRERDKKNADEKPASEPAKQPAPTGAVQPSPAAPVIPVDDRVSGEEIPTPPAEDPAPEIGDEVDDAQLAPATPRTSDPPGAGAPGAGTPPTTGTAPPTSVSIGTPTTGATHVEVTPPGGKTTPPVVK